MKEPFKSTKLAKKGVWKYLPHEIWVSFFFHITNFRQIEGRFNNEYHEIVNYQKDDSKPTRKMKDSGVWFPPR